MSTGTGQETPLTDDMERRFWASDTRIEELWGHMRGQERENRRLLALCHAAYLHIQHLLPWEDSVRLNRDLFSADNKYHAMQKEQAP